MFNNFRIMSIKNNFNKIKNETFGYKKYIDFYDNSLLEILHDAERKISCLDFLVYRLQDKQDV